MLYTHITLCNCDQVNITINKIDGNTNKRLYNFKYHLGITRSLILIGNLLADAMVEEIQRFPDSTRWANASIAIVRAGDISASIDNKPPGIGVFITLNYKQL